MSAAGNSPSAPRSSGARWRWRRPLPWGLAVPATDWAARRGPSTPSSWARSGAMRWRRRAASTLPLGGRGLRTQLAATVARGNGVVRSRARSRLPAPRHLAGSCSAVLQLRPMEAGSDATTSDLPAAPASRQPAVAAGIGRLTGPGCGSQRLLGGSGSAAQLRPHSDARLSGGRHPSPFVRRARAPAGPRNHAPELGNRFLYPDADQGAGRFDRDRCPFALKMLFLCCGGTELAPPRPTRAQGDSCFLKATPR